jgi:hypothetical protein
MLKNDDGHRFGLHFFDDAPLISRLGPVVTPRYHDASGEAALGEVVQ